MGLLIIIHQGITKCTGSVIVRVRVVPVRVGVSRLVLEKGDVVWHFDNLPGSHLQTFRKVTFWKWLPLRLLKYSSISPTAVLFRTTIYWSILSLSSVLFTGLIKPGGTVVEGTAGNTGLCFTLIGCHYSCFSSSSSCTIATRQSFWLVFDNATLWWILAI